MGQLADLPPFLLAVAFLVAVHGGGTFRMARACGVKGPLFGQVRTRGGAASGATAPKFTLAILPLGAVTRMLDRRMGQSALASKHAATLTHCGSVPAIVCRRACGELAGRHPDVHAGLAWMGAGYPGRAPVHPCLRRLERAGGRSGDWVHAVSSDGEAGTGCAALPDLLDAVALRSGAARTSTSR